MRNTVSNYSCGYFQNSLNFEIANPTPQSKEKAPIFEAVIDYLERGFPTRPTHHLEGLLIDAKSDFNWTEAQRFDQSLIKPFAPNWTKTIKGYDKNNLFPARKFFENLIDQHLPNYSFIKNLIIPECNFSDILASSPSNFGASKDWAVDFFLPQANLVIEINGSQHEEQAQELKDSRRIFILKKHGIRTHEIKTEKINENSAEIKNYFDALGKELDRFDEIQEIKRFVDQKLFETKQDCFDLIAIARFQRFLIEYFANIKLKKNEIIQIEIKSDFDPIYDWPILAVDDLYNTYDIMRFHFPSAPILPKLQTSLVEEFSTNKNILKLNLSIFSHLDDCDLDPEIYYVSNSQKQNLFLESKTNTNTRPKIYFKRRNSQIKLATDRRKFKENLEQFNGITFGLNSFRPGQQEIISTAINNQAILGLVPTGGGKSLCFQTLGAIGGGCTIVVCPITALVRDHVLELNQFGFRSRAEFISAEITGPTRDFIFNKLEHGELKFLFLSPEQFQKEEFRQRFRKLYNNALINRVVIDEVHCISEWGHDFRTSYLNLADTIHNLAPEVSVLCLTATAAVKVIEDIQIEFDISEENILYFMDQSREELSFNLIKPKNKISMLKEILASRLEAGHLNDQAAFIVFSPIINDSKNNLGLTSIASELRQKNQNIKIGIFPGKQPKDWHPDSEFRHIEAKNIEAKNFDSYKIEVQKQFKENSITGIVATKAFGMGVNKPNVRLAVHYGMPQSMESLYQEAGRAGRDKKPAECITLFTQERRVNNAVFDPKTNLEELIKIRQSMENSYPGDLGQQLFFLTTSNKPITAELDECIIELEYLRKSGTNGIAIINEVIDQKSENGNNRKKEKIIYRLKQLGFVSDWTVESFRHGIYRVFWRDQSSEQLAASIKKTIMKYSGMEGGLANAERKIEEIKHFESSAQERELIKTLLEWNYNHFVYQRRQSLKNLYEACEAFESPEKFKKVLEGYFKTDRIFSALPDIIKMDPLSAVEAVFSLLTTKGGNLRTPKQLENLANSLSIQLESYQDNPGLNLLSGLLRLYRDDFENLDGRPRLEAFLKQLGKYQHAKKEIERLVDLISKFKPGTADLGYNCLLNIFENAELALSIFSLTKSDKAESIVISSLNKRLEALL
jgi:ATP-dependent DNA helicase RecQ